MQKVRNASLNIVICLCRGNFIFETSTELIQIEKNVSFSFFPQKANQRESLSCFEWARTQTEEENLCHRESFSMRQRRRLFWGKVTQILSTITTKPQLMPWKPINVPSSSEITQFSILIHVMNLRGESCGHKEGTDNSIQPSGNTFQLAYCDGKKDKKATAVIKKRHRNKLCMPFRGNSILFPLTSLHNFHFLGITFSFHSPSLLFPHSAFPSSSHLLCWTIFSSWFWFFPLYVATLCGVGESL